MYIKTISTLINSVEEQKIFLQRLKSTNFNESACLNYYKPDECFNCSYKAMEIVDHDKNGLNIYKCENCGKEFTIYESTKLENIEQPLKLYSSLLSRLFKSEYLDPSKKLSKIDIECLNNIVEIYKPRNIHFTNMRVEIEVFRLQEKNVPSDNDFIIAIATDGTRVKVKNVGIGTCSKYTIYEAFKNTFIPGTTIVHKDSDIFSKIIDDFGLIDIIIDDNIDNENNFIKKLDLVNKFNIFYKYCRSNHFYHTLDVYMSLFELIYFNQDIEIKIAQILAILIYTKIIIPLDELVKLIESKVHINVS